MSLKQQLINAKSWEERYRLIIQSGKNLTQPSTQELEQMPLLQGCEAKLWFKVLPMQNNLFYFQAYSEARIINGLLWILLDAIQGKTATQLHQFDLTAYFTELGIAQRLTSTRLNGLQQIEEIIKNLLKHNV